MHLFIRSFDIITHTHTYTHTHTHTHTHTPKCFVLNTLEKIPFQLGQLAKASSQVQVLGQVESTSVLLVSAESSQKWPKLLVRDITSNINISKRKFLS